MAARLREKYHKEIKGALQKELALENPMAVPRLEKIVVNMGLGEATQIGEAFEIARMNAGFIEFSAISGHVLIGVPKRPLQTRELQRLDLVARGGLDRL